MFALLWRWEMTPREYMAGYTYIPEGIAAHLVLETKPFLCPRLPLEGTEYTYQLAIAESSPSPDIRLKGQNQDLPRSGDDRSGVLIFHGDRIIASTVFMAHHATVVHPDYRGQGLAHRMLFEWESRTKRVAVAIHRITLATAKVLLRSHREVVERAAAEGKPVPERVIRAVAEGTEAAAILAHAALVGQAK
jgi:GNAT superfamily N-acetyltransferase